MTVIVANSRTAAAEAVELDGIRPDRVRSSSRTPCSRRRPHGWVEGATARAWGFDLDDVGRRLRRQLPARKGLLGLLAVADQLRARTTGLRYVLVGEGPLEIRPRQTIERLALRRHRRPARTGRGRPLPVSGIRHLRPGLGFGGLAERSPRGRRLRAADRRDGGRWHARRSLPRMSTAILVAEGRRGSSRVGDRRSWPPTRPSGLGWAAPPVPGRPTSRRRPLAAVDGGVYRGLVDRNPDRPTSRPWRDRSASIDA